MIAAGRRLPNGLLVWGVPAATLLHDLEEGLTFARYAPRVRQLAPESLGSAIPGTRWMYLALGVATLVPIGLAVIARRPTSARWATYGLFLVAAVLLVNVAWHLVAAALLRGYAPGLATAVAVNLPLTVVVLRRGRSSGWLARRALWMSLLAATLLHAPVFVAAIALVRAFV